jgi:hypothetical protein
MAVYFALHRIDPGRAGWNHSDGSPRTPLVLQPAITTGRFRSLRRMPRARSGWSR